MIVKLICNCKRLLGALLPWQQIASYFVPAVLLQTWDPVTSAMFNQKRSIGLIVFF